MSRWRPQEWDDAEAYFTPLPVVGQGVRSVATLIRRPPRVVIDIGAGAGGFGQVLRALYPRARLVAVEIRGSELPFLRRHYDDVIIGDAMTVPLPRADLVVSNPPFKLTVPLAERAIGALSPDGVCAFLVRQTFGDSEEATAFLERHPPTAELTIAGRVAMAAAGEETKDHFGYQWLVWPSFKNDVNGLVVSWPRRMLPRLDAQSLCWTQRPGTGRLLDVDDDLVVDLAAYRQQLTGTAALTCAPPRRRHV